MLTALFSTLPLGVKRWTGVSPRAYALAHGVFVVTIAQPRCSNEPC
jgi:hypothetical protein